MFFTNLAKSLKMLVFSDQMFRKGCAPRQSKSPMANLGPNGSKSPAATLTALQSETHRIQMMKV